MSLRYARAGQLPSVVKLRVKARRFRDQRVDLGLRALERARQSLARGETDILILSDSTCLYGSPYDTDHTRIPELICRETGQRVTVIAVAGYGVTFHDELLRILALLPQRPKALVHSFAVRSCVMTNVIAHPAYNYPDTLARLRAITTPPQRIRSWHKHAGATAEDYAAFDAQPITSHWSGETTIGAFRGELRGIGPTPWPIEKEKLVYDYLHGEVVRTDHPGFDEWRVFARRVAEYDVPTVGYVDVPPIERGELHYPGEFRDIALHNRALVTDTIMENAGSQHLVVAEDFPKEDFGNFHDGTEHFSLGGRTKIAVNVAEGLRKLGAF